MGTRSLTRVYEDKQQLVCIYRQMDGYPSGHGADLLQFLNGRKIVNGFNSGMQMPISNGASDLAAQLVAYLKQDNEVGGIYIYPITTKDAGQDYEYYIHVSSDPEPDDKPGSNITIIVKDYKRKLFEGSIKEFGTFCTQED